MRSEHRELTLDHCELFLALRIAAGVLGTLDRLVGLGLVQVVAANGGVGEDLGCTSRMPPATKINCLSPPPDGVISTVPGLMRVMSGVWRG